MWAGLVSNLGLLLKAGDELVGIGEWFLVMYPGSESVPSGVMWLWTAKSGNSRGKLPSKTGSCGARSAAKGVDAVFDRLSEVRVGLKRARSSSKRRVLGAVLLERLGGVVQNKLETPSRWAPNDNSESAVSSNGLTRCSC